MKGKLLSKCPTVCDPVDYSLPGSSAHGIFQARVLEWGAIAFSDSRSLLVIYFIHSSVYMSIPISQFTPHPIPLSPMVTIRLSKSHLKETYHFYLLLVNRSTTLHYLRLKPQTPFFDVLIVPSEVRKAVTTSGSTLKRSLLIAVSVNRAGGDPV